MEAGRQGVRSLVFDYVYRAIWGYVVREQACPSTSRPLVGDPARQDGLAVALTALAVPQGPQRDPMARPPDELLGMRMRPPGVATHCKMRPPLQGVNGVPSAEEGPREPFKITS
jgi:hypothetical protein